MSVLRLVNGWDVVKKDGGLGRTKLKEACRELQIHGFGENTNGVEEYKTLLMDWDKNPPKIAFDGPESEGAQRWSLNAHCRFLMVSVQPRMRELLKNMNATATRKDLEAKKTPWDAYFAKHAEIYRDKIWQAAAGLPQCVTNDARFDSKIDPDDVKILNISEEKLEERFRESRTRFTIIYDKWTRSGNNDADNFYSFCNANLFNLVCI